MPFLPLPVPVTQPVPPLLHLPLCAGACPADMPRGHIPCIHNTAACSLPAQIHSISPLPAEISIAASPHIHNPFLSPAVRLHPHAPNTASALRPLLSATIPACLSLPLECPAPLAADFPFLLP